ncbi:MULTISPECIES: Na+/H+ antiporter subunit G [unclassified Agarivorans]|uniref:Na+/H+ antiporter subunit G n=1 Tax=unclassified Agarivorans TaxID=2636026 RepID=UPI0026E48E1D|nr:MULTISPECIES: Na+/H+ antiporter subunit G [unclassified Agarivorans]MDO6687104.1 Na+/H+ antiporter subunit G [Agarivorans sp. 3_MG-2023]MDO6713484.1 Na+/H+ antiporter subunit G [Agarivorans sp. 2_MG-2023]MDO6765257.1 Na+/H+ antiporter subunit G [Agarivorans sp. 1_MG-2023]
MTNILEIVVSILLVLGAIIMLIGSIGLAKLPDYFTRLHAPTKASTLGVGCILIASMVYFSFDLGRLNLKEFLITMFLFITAPIAAHMLAKAGLQYKVKLKEDTYNKELSAKAYLHKAPDED